MKKPRLFNLDTVMIDIVMKIEALPVRGSDTLASQHLVTTGGGFNVMSAATRHGLAAVYAGRLGTGPFGDIARTSLRGDDVDAPIEDDRVRDSGFCLVFVDAQGERTFVTSKGAELDLELADLETLHPAAGDYVYVSGYNLVYPEIRATVTAWIEGLDNDVVVAFDPGARVMDIEPGVLSTVLSRGDWLLCNAAESHALSGESSSERAMDALLARTRRHGVLVHDGAEGCLVATREMRPVRVKGFVTDVVDTNGAGDTHNGVFLAELARGRDVLEAARHANAAAAMAISELGPATCPRRDEVAAWYAKFPS